MGLRMVRLICCPHLHVHMYCSAIEKALITCTCRYGIAAVAAVNSQQHHRFCAEPRFIVDDANLLACLPPCSSYMATKICLPSPCRVLLFDDDSFKSVPGEEGNMVIVPAWCVDTSHGCTLVCMHTHMRTHTNTTHPRPHTNLLIYLPRHRVLKCLPCFVCLVCRIKCPINKRVVFGSKLDRKTN